MAGAGEWHREVSDCMVGAGEWHRDMSDCMAGAVSGILS